MPPRPQQPTSAPVNHRLRAARLALGLTGTETAAAVGVSREHLSKFEHAKARNSARDFSPELIWKLARFLDVHIPVDEIFAAEVAPLPEDAE